MYINGVVCSWTNVEMRVREWIAAGRDLNQVPTVVTGHDFAQKNPCAMTFLHLAVAMGHERLVQTLLENGAHVSPRDKRGLTPLMYAHLHEADMYEIVALLLRHGADPDRELPGAPGMDPATSHRAVPRTKKCAPRRGARNLRERLEEVFEVSRGVLLLQVVPDDALEEAQEGVLQDGGVEESVFFV